MNNNILDFQHKMFTLVIVITWILYISIAVGLSINAPKYLETFDYYVKIYVSLFLLWRFNPFTKTTFTELDRKIAFSAGILIFATTSLHSLLLKYFSEIKDIVVDETK
jgi:hypothetical protein